MMDVLEPMLLDFMKPRTMMANHPLHRVCSVLHNSRHTCEDPIETQGRCPEENGLPKAKHRPHSHKEPADTHHAGEEIVESSFNHQHQHQEVHQEWKKCCTDCTPLHTVIDIEPTTMHACMSVEKIELN
ncbi:hypothetical protein NC653_040336 [Populus alba x Populus x berolinensis]|uniref:Uncharacterized protein n=2 Tax=Populus TaxID=3689 RepID=A0A4U5PUT4_POPAL|nr:hypothetical protein NC653_040336 [Populus alba x Populus x berolinensis]TKS00781.1 hypothetical protein D5086_0000179250 [Populus alba]